MRDVVFVRMSKGQLLQLDAMLTRLGGVSVPELQEFVREAREGFNDDPGNLIERALVIYADGDGPSDLDIEDFESPDIDVDPDAPISRTDEGVWVGGWLWVPNQCQSEEGEEDEEDEEGAEDVVA
jgi:hypothetical protein